jgi:transcription antitermination factor NusG
VDRWKTVCLPLFPGYVFCRVDPVALSGVLATSGVIDVVRIGPRPEPVDTGEIEVIRMVVNSNLAAEPHPALVRGQRVTVGGGPLRGVTGVLLEVRKGLRLAVSVELLHRSVIVEIERDWAVPCEPAPSAAYPAHAALGG